MELDHVIIRGAREHNLKGITVRIPKKELVCFTGVSGSGKSSLAFDTLFAEGQRRYVESLSTYARQFLGQLEKPKYDTIRGLAPTISIEQKAASKNPRSTVGTITEIADYLRVLYARIGIQHCHECGRVVEEQSAEQIAEEIARIPEGERFMILAPLVRQRKGEQREVLAEAKAEGFARVRVDGEVHRVEEVPELDGNRKHSVELVVDRLVGGGDHGRLVEAVEMALRLGDGVLLVARDGHEDVVHSESRACPACGIGFREPTPQYFSFNSPQGMCPECDGLGTAQSIDPDAVVPDPSRSIREGAVDPWPREPLDSTSYRGRKARAVVEGFDIDPDVPFAELPEADREVVLFGSEEKISFPRRRRRSKWRQRRWRGVIPELERRLDRTSSSRVRRWIMGYQADSACPTCDGGRVRPEAAAVQVAGRTIVEVQSLPIERAHAFFDGLELPGTRGVIARELVKEVGQRLSFLLNVGLGYLTLDRQAATLSGGEAQRIRLASQVGSELTGVIYILDEPSIGLHQRDNRRLLDTLGHLRDIGNTVVVVEHDRETIETADHVVDFGPAAGVYGGEIVASGPPEAIAADEESLTGKYLSGRERIEVPDERRLDEAGRLVVRGARLHNLDDVDVTFPLGRFISVTGVSGAGKSSLVNGILAPALSRILHRAREVPGDHDQVEAFDAEGEQRPVDEVVDKVIVIDQQPIGRTPRSNPATYVGVFDYIRKLFAKLPLSRMHGYEKGRFSFNVKGGRCETCKGDGMIQVEMHFLADVYVPCEECEGQRFNEATLKVKFKGHTIADVLDLTVREALDLFENQPKIVRYLEVLSDVGLDYLTLGQPSPTLSGGEAQRVKLSTELARRSTGRTVYILDEPTTGLHFDDIRKLLAVLERFVEGGNTVIVIEHNLDVVKCADWIVDLGPEGGHAGGRVVSVGTPEQVAADPDSRTGVYLNEVLHPGPVSPAVG